MARNVSRLIETGVENEVKRGQSALRNVSIEVQRAIATTLPTLKQHLRSSGNSTDLIPQSKIATSLLIIPYSMLMVINQLSILSSIDRYAY